MVETLIPNPRNAHSTPNASTGYPTRRSIRAAAARAPLAVVAPAAMQDPAVYVAPAPSKSGKSKSIQRRIVGAATVLLVPGLLVGTSIPAFALGGPVGVASVYEADADSQSLLVDTALDGTALSRDAFDATTTAELEAKKQAAVAAAAQRLAAASGGRFSTVGPRAAGDDYPWRGGGGLSPLGYVIRQCTDFAAWRLNRDAGTSGGNFKYVWAKMTPGGGSASAWAGAWRNNGWKTSHTPVRGAVAWFNGNHVAYVKSVDGNSVNLEEYNWGGDASYHTRTVSASSVGLFLYPPP